MLNEKLLSGIKEVNKLYTNATLAGVDVIKLLWRKQGIPYARVSGFELLVGISKGSTFEESMNGGKPIYDNGPVEFFPDDGDGDPKESRCWGYIPKTKRNMLKLASSLKKRWFGIIDPAIREEAIALAEEKGWPTSPGEHRHEYVRYTPAQARQEKKASSLEDENRKLKKDMVSLTKQNEDLMKKMDQLIGAMSNQKTIEEHNAFDNGTTESGFEPLNVESKDEDKTPDVDETEGKKSKPASPPANTTRGKAGTKK